MNTGPNAVTSGDFNRDIRPDLAVANRTADDLSVLLGDGAGGFAEARDFGVGDDTIFIILGDFNRDSNLDFATVNPGGNFGQFSSSVLLNNCGAE